MAKKTNGGNGIGYGRPPAHGQYKPGQSGNRRGRPRGSQNTTTILNKILDQPHKKGRGKSTSPRTKREEVFEKLVEDSIQGDWRARRDLLQYLERTGQSEATPPARIVIYRIPDNGRGMIDPEETKDSPE